MGVTIHQSHFQLYSGRLYRTPGTSINTAAGLVENMRLLWVVLVLRLGDVRMQEVEEGDSELEADSKHQSYNRTLAMLTQARQDVQNVTKGIEDMIEGIDRTVERQNQAVSRWVSWLMANSLCHGDLNMTGADNLWRHSRKLTDEIHKYETRLDTLKLDLEEHNIKLAELEKIAQQAQ